MLVSLVVAALTFVFALFFLSGSLAYMTKYKDGNSIGAEDLVEQSQGFVEAMVALGIVFILLAALLFITSSSSRRNYYITNYVAVGLFVVFALFMSIFIFANVGSIQSAFLNDINWDTVGDKIANLNGLYPISKDDTYTFAVGYVVGVIVLIDAILVVLSTVWKYMLMKGEKQLLESSAKVQAEEVA